MKLLKKLIAIILICVVLIFIGLMVLPLDTFFATKSATVSGYDVSGNYDDTEYRYYYSKLNEKEKKAYTIICAQIADFPNEILIPKLTDDELKNVFEAVSYDNPEFFFLGNRCSITGIGSLNYFVPQYAMSKSVYEEKMANVSAVASEVLGQVSLSDGASTMDVYRAELYIHDLIAKNCEYTKETDNITCSIYGMLVDGRASCEGYARTLQYLLKQLGIANYVIVGQATDKEGNMEGHMWNVVTINGNKYNVDATWDDYSVSNEIDSPDNSVSHTYFNIPTEKLKFTHVADDENAWARCTSDDLNYFEINGLLFSKFDNSSLNVFRQAIARKLIEGNRSIEIAFTDKKAYDAAINSLFDNANVYKVMKTANMVAPSSNRIKTNQIQYTYDEDLLIIRLFFAKA
ncbi:MAG: transglutaminase domain-containing protein [Oscillospiraceae bacterium]|nr:transglutaminase domain-containing protein [Oscillospiraceae bacterium]